ncbi:LOW QUALITY PROTEIN: hypothetical protein AAY473_023287 [Plecturocebus cupreus]
MRPPRSLTRAVPGGSPGPGSAADAMEPAQSRGSSRGTDVRSCGRGFCCSLFAEKFQMDSCLCENREETCGHPFWLTEDTCRRSEKLSLFRGSVKAVKQSHP